MIYLKTEQKLRCIHFFVYFTFRNLTQDIRGNKECASMCSINSTTCNSFIYDDSMKICSLGFIGTSHSTVEADNDAFAYIDTG